MPRPKRAKVASSRPATSNPAFAAMSQPTNQHLKELETRKQTATTKRKRDARPPIVKPSTTMKQATTETNPPVSAGTIELSAVERLRRRRQEATRGDDRTVSASQVKVAPPPSDGHLSRRSSSREIARGPAPPSEFNSAQSLRHGTPQAPSREGSDDLYGLSPEGEKSQMLLLQGHGARDPQRGQSSTAKAQPTPLREASLMALKHFKRRARKPSILRSHRSSMQSALHLSSDTEGFHPDDESTPLRLDGGSTLDSSLQAGLETSSDPRKRKFSQFETHVHVPQSSPPLSRVDDPIALMKDTIDLVPHGSSEPASDAPELPEYVPESAVATQNVPEEIWSQTMAPPKSSSSLEEYAHQQRTQPQQQAKESVADATGRRRKRNTRTKSARTRPAALSTAALQDLLPQRRRRLPRKGRPDAFDVLSDDTDDLTTSSADEISKPRTRKAKTIQRTSKPHSLRATATSRSAVQKLKSRETEKEPTPNSTKKTYGRQSTSDKENDDSTFPSDIEDSMLDEIVVRPFKRTAQESKEIKALADKFAVVDEWEMEFESVDASGDGLGWR